MINVKYAFGIFVLLLVGCGGSNNNDENNNFVNNGIRPSGSLSDPVTLSENDKSSPPAALKLKTGVLIDSPVINMGYKTDTLAGVTNKLGEFSYLEGEEITFAVGDMSFPSILASALITPLDLAEAATGGSAAVPVQLEQRITAPVVLNILRLLQSLDKDGLPDNGIEISDEATLSAAAVDFSLPPSEFEQLPIIQNLLANGGQIAALSEMVSSSQALKHFKDQLIARNLFTESDFSGLNLASLEEVVDGVTEFVDNAPVDIAEVIEQAKVLLEANPELITDLAAQAQSLAGTNFEALIALMAQTQAIAETTPDVISALLVQAQLLLAETPDLQSDLLAQVQQLLVQKPSLVNELAALADEVLDLDSDEEIVDTQVETPEVAKKPAVEKPKAEQPEAEKPEVEKPKAEQPEVEKPKAEKPEAEKPKAEKPEAEKPEVEKPEVEKPEVEKPEVEKPEVEKPKAEQPEVEKPKAEKPEAEKPEAEKPEAEKPEVEKPEVEKPEVEKPVSPPQVSIRNVLIQQLTEAYAQKNGAGFTQLELDILYQSALQQAEASGDKAVIAELKSFEPFINPVLVNSLLLNNL